MVECSECKSEDIHQESYELVEYCLKDLKFVEITFNSELQDYVCQSCGNRW